MKENGRLKGIVTSNYGEQTVPAAINGWVVQSSNKKNTFYFHDQIQINRVWFTSAMKSIPERNSWPLLNKHNARKNMVDILKNEERGGKGYEKLCQSESKVRYYIWPYTTEPIKIFYSMRFFSFRYSITSLCYILLIIICFPWQLFYFLIFRQFDMLHDYFKVFFFNSK